VLFDGMLISGVHPSKRESARSSIRHRYPHGGRIPQLCCFPSWDFSSPGARFAQADGWGADFVQPTEVRVHRPAGIIWMSSRERPPKPGGLDTFQLQQLRGCHLRGELPYL
jgi:hypothetical protein